MRGRGPSARRPAQRPTCTSTPTCMPTCMLPPSWLPLRSSRRCGTPGSGPSSSLWKDELLLLLLLLLLLPPLLLLSCQGEARSVEIHDRRSTMRCMLHARMAGSRKKIARACSTPAQQHEPMCARPTCAPSSRGRLRMRARSMRAQLPRLFPACMHAHGQHGRGDHAARAQGVAISSTESACGRTIRRAQPMPSRSDVGLD